MAKRRTKVLQARTSESSRDEDSLLMRSAESLGRVIGSLQRQMQGGTTRVSRVAEEARNMLPDLPPLESLFGRARRTRPTPAARARTRKRPAAAAAKAKKTTGRETPARKTKKKQTSTVTKRPAGRKTTVSRKKAPKR